VSSQTTKRPPAGRTGGKGALAAALLVVAGLLSLAFFFSFWGTNAEGLGRHDMGIALGLSFGVPITLYGSLSCAALALVASLAAAYRRRPLALWLAALGVSVLPVLFLLLVDLFRSGRSSP
jgi:hypothetical protein